ncbi:MAG: enoyl-CoA hydratase-related protein, partial [bacterium]|nr:enoyl-CoA hydratase-related protein [bacterium]
MSKRIIREVKDNGIAHIRMQDEQRKNIFAEDFIRELIENLDYLEEKEKPKVLILSGMKDVFSAGAEKQNLLDLCDGKVFVKDLVISEKLINAPFPVIAAMEGHAVGGGLVMAVCCDIVIA